MKKVLLTAFISIGVLAASAQTQKGNYLVGGNAGFSFAKEGDFKTTSIQFNPRAGYFFMDNFAAGLGLSLQSMTEKISSFKATTTGIGVVPFLRYYFLPLQDKIKLLAEINGGFGTARYKEEGEDAEKSNFTTFGIAAGPAIFLTPNTALEFTIGYNSTKIKDNDDATGTFGLNIGFQIHLNGAKK